MMVPRSRWEKKLLTFLVNGAQPVDWHKPWMKKNTPNDRGSVETPIATPDKIETSMPLRITFRVPILSAVIPQMNWPIAYARR